MNKKLSSCLKPFINVFSKKHIDKKIGYMCGTDYEYELGSASDGCRIYPSKTDLKKHLRCWTECGIVEVEIVLIKKHDD